MPLRAAATAIETVVRVGEPTAGHTGSRVARVAGPIQSTVTLLEEGNHRLCILTSHFGTSVDDATVMLQRALGKALDLPPQRVVIFSSHNHSAPLLETISRTGYEAKPAAADLTPLGRRVVKQLQTVARVLRDKLEPVTVHYAEGREHRITYNRKGRRADGSTYFMREEDRVLLGEDFCGDIDAHAPVVVLRRRSGKALGAIVQFNGHPVTIYRPEQFIVGGDWPQEACLRLSAALGRDVPVGFLQGCAGDVNSKCMFSGDVKLARRYGRWLGDAYRQALGEEKTSSRGGFDYAVAPAEVPFAALPAVSTLQRELAEMRDFVRRAEAGDDDTLACVGLNFPRALSAAYRGKLVKYIMPWNEWAIRVKQTGREGKLPKALPLNVYCLRLGDVAIVGMPTEPYVGVARQIRNGSPFDLTIPCGYTNQATGFIGYIPDSPNCGDREYMSAFYRYTRFLPPFRKPAGDVLARAALQTLRQFHRQEPRS